MLGGVFAREEVRAQATDWGDWPGDVPAGSNNVTPTSALQLLTVYGCVRMISDGVSTLPLDAFREGADGERLEVPKPTWLREPTVDLDFTEWCTQVLASLLLHGNAYLVVLRNDTNSIVELVPLDPCKVRVERDSRGRKFYRINGVVFTGEITHIKGVMMPGSDVGYSPIEAARLSIGLGLSAQRYGSDAFERDLNMPGVIEMPRKALPESMRAIADNWRRKRNKGGRGLPGVLDDGATWRPTGVTNEQAQFLQTRRYTAAEIAGQLFLLDPSELGIGVEGSSMTYANLAQRDTRRVTVSYLPWIIRIEKALSRLLANPRYVKFNVQGLLRGDIKTMYESFFIGTAGAAFLDVDEVRAWLELPPMPPGAAPATPVAADTTEVP